MSKHVLLAAVLAVSAMATPSSSYASTGSFWKSFYAWLIPTPNGGCIPSENDDCGVQEPQ